MKIFNILATLQIYGDTKFTNYRKIGGFPFMLIEYRIHLVATEHESNLIKQVKQN